MKIKRKGSAAWQGGIKDGKGTISTESGALKAYPYGFASRFEGQRGSNPEELIAAAHASCFTMALSLILGEAKLTAEQMETSAEVTLEQVEGGYAITAVHLTLKAKIPGADQAAFEKLTTLAKAGCPFPSSSRPRSRSMRLCLADRTRRRVVGEHFAQAARHSFADSSSPHGRRFHPGNGSGGLERRRTGSDRCRCY